jgi:hypothetical protein
MLKTSICVLLLLFQSSNKNIDHIHLRDNSDWWSLFVSNHSVKFQKMDTPEANLQILGISLDEEGFSNIPAKLGKAAEVTRGDASTGRGQFCYTSADGSVRVIFERGEVEYAYYLFTGGPGWKGGEYCHKSDLVSGSASTGSGLQLRMNPADVQAVLGKPNIATAGKLIYARSIRKETSQEDLKKIRERSPSLTDAQLNEYRFYDLNVSIVARFSGSKLIYLAVAKSETN